MQQAVLLSACGLLRAELSMPIVTEGELATMMRNASCRRYIPPPRYEEAVTTLEPAPFADLFGHSDNLFGQVCLWRLADHASATTMPASCQAIGTCARNSVEESLNKCVHMLQDVIL